VIGKVTRGTDMPHLVRYLFSEASGTDKSNEHVDPRVVAADDSLGVERGVALSKEEHKALGRALDAPAALYGAEVSGGHVWHLSLSTKAGVDREMSDQEWADVACAAVSRLGFAGGEGRAPCRWVAVRHGKSSAGNDHMHIAVNLVGEDGRVASTSNDYRKLSALCREMEARYGLFVVEGRVKTGGMPGVSRAEQEKAKRAGRSDPERVEVARIVRAAASAAASEDEFVRRLRVAGLAAKPRYDRSGAHRVVGYSVAQAPSDGGKAVFFSGTALGGDLRLPALRARWETSVEARKEATAEWGRYRDPAATSDETSPGTYRVYDWDEAAGEWGQGRPAVATERPERAVYSPRQWHEAGVRLGHAVRSLAEVPAEDVIAWRAAAGDAAGMLAALSGRLEATPGPIAKASDVLARSAQGRDPALPARPPGPSGTLRTVSAVMAQAQITDEVALAWQLMLTEMLRLVQSIAQAHEARAEATQAGRLAGEARAALNQARAQLGSAQRVAELVPALVAAAEEAEQQAGEEDDLRFRRRKPAAAMRPVDYAALAARKQYPQHDPARGLGR